MSLDTTHLIEGVLWVGFGAFAGWAVGMTQCRIEKHLHSPGHSRRSHHLRHHKNEQGLTRHPLVLDIALLIVVAITVYSAFMSQKASNEVSAAVNQNSKGAQCTYTTMFGVTQAADARTSYALEQAKANQKLQKSQARMIGVLLNPKNQQNPDAGRQALANYFKDLTSFTHASSQYTEAINSNPYPKPKDYYDCLKDAGITFSTEGP